VVLLDGGIGVEAALRWTRYWRGLEPPAAVLVLELLDDAALILDCIEAGACGYTVRGASAGEVTEAILRVQRGAAACSPEVAARLFARLAALSAARTPTVPAGIPLTARELEVLRCIAADCSNQEIAERLVLQLSTVKHHVHNILEKLSLRHRWDAVRLASEQGWLDEEPTVRRSARA
jgi:two-component system nitrate/nitrite response regulator NarL